MNALLCAVLEKVCEHISNHDVGARAHVASKMLEAAARGETSRERLKEIGREALTDAPTM
ncbi:hypothetical protein N2605_27020 [Bradyrhizobium yuanmingense]|nr:hypothetical protein N2605_27020 [Bradyrhizobium sp. CB1024]